MPETKISDHWKVVFSPSVVRKSAFLKFSSHPNLEGVNSQVKSSHVKIYKINLWHCSINENLMSIQAHSYSSQPSKVHWLSSSIFPCLVIRLFTVPIQLHFPSSNIFLLFLLCSSSPPQKKHIFILLIFIHILKIFFFIQVFC